MVACDSSDQASGPVAAVSVRINGFVWRCDSEVLTSAPFGDGFIDAALGGPDADGVPFAPEGFIIVSGPNWNMPPFAAWACATAADGSGAPTSTRSRQS